MRTSMFSRTDLLEARELGGQRVDARSEIEDRVVPFTVGRGGRGDVGRDVGGGDGHARQPSAGTVGDPAGDAAAEVLRIGRGDDGGKQHDCEKAHTSHYALPSIPPLRMFAKQCPRRRGILHQFRGREETTL